MCLYSITDEDTTPESIWEGDFSIETTENDDREFEEDLR